MFSVPLPSLLPALCFGLMAALVIHVSNRLIERAANMVGSAARASAFSRAALCIGPLVWALDAGGFFLYPGQPAQRAAPVPMLLALLLHAISARFSIPALISTRHPLRIAGAACQLSGGILLAHLLLASGFGAEAGWPQWPALLVAASVAATLSAVLALRHRAARLEAVHGSFRPMGWQDKLLAGLAILLLHWLLMCSWPLPAQPVAASAHAGLPLLLTLALFGLLLMLEHASQLGLPAPAHRQADSTPASLPGMSAQQLAILVEHLPRLLAGPALALHFQPILTASGGLRRFEVLSRIDDPLLGRIAPDRFFAACALAGLTRRADHRVLQASIEQLAQWRSQLGLSVSISVNVAPSTLLAADFETWLLGCLQRHGCERWRLKLELTEHALIGNAIELSDALRRLRQLGIGVLMDDFGAGYSSLGLLADLPIEGIKCDRQLIHNLQADRKRQVLLQHICQLSQELGLGVTVEGVESAADLVLIRQLGAELIQGYHLARPMVAAALPAWLAQWRADQAEGVALAA